MSAVKEIKKKTPVNDPSIKFATKMKHKPGKLTNFLYLAPAFIALIIFIFIPLFFSFLISLYDNPTPLDLNTPIEYYLEFGNLALSSLYRFFTLNQVEYNNFGIFMVDGLYFASTIIVLFFYIRGFYRVISKKQRIFNWLYLVIAIFTGILVSPLIMWGLKWFFLNFTIVSVNVKLPIEEYRTVITSSTLDFSRIFFNTIFWTFGCTFFHVSIGMFLAVRLNREFPGKKLFRAILVLPWAIPSLVSTLVWRYFIYDQDTGYLGKITRNLPGNASYSFSILNLLFLLVILGIIVGIMILINKKIFEKANIHKTLASLLKFGIGVILVYFGYVLNREVNTAIIYTGENSFLSYKIIDVPSISTTFWITDDVYLFGTQIKMVTISSILMNIWLGVPFMMVSFSAALQSIPLELYEAAKIDGASKWQEFVKITFPLSIPTLTTVSLLGIIWTFNLFNIIFIMARYQNGIGDGRFYNIFVTFIFERYGQSRYSQAAALSFIVFLILVIFSRVYQKLLDGKKKFELEMT